MSHYCVLVLLSGALDEIRRAPDAAIEKVLAPFDESLRVPEYDKPCYCIGMEARKRANDAAVLAAGSPDDIRVAFWQRDDVNALREADSQEAEEKIDALWETVIEPYKAAYKAALDADLMKDKSDANCLDCKGSGTAKTTYNPKSQWDWYSVGGRWSGSLEGKEGGENVLPLAQVRSDFVPFAIVTPDGEWHEKGKMGWFGMSSGDKDDWEPTAKALMEKHKDSVAVLVDCHI